MAKKRHAHHGGAWKVAYADFVTAMMALFLVLWLSSQDEKIKEAVERSFRNPFNSVTKESTGIIPNKDTQAVKSKDGNFDSASAVELNMLRRLAEEVVKTLQAEWRTIGPAPKDVADDVWNRFRGACDKIYDRSRAADAPPPPPPGAPAAPVGYSAPKLGDLLKK